MAGLAATRLFAAAGAGGVALTAWALRRSGMEAPRGGLPDGRLPRRCSTPSTWARSSSSGSGSTSASSTGPAPFAITVVPAIFALLLDRDLPGHVAAAGRRRAADHGVVRGHGARRAHHGQGRDDPRLGRRRRAHGDRPRARPRVGRPRRGRLVGLRHRHAVGVLSRLRPDPPPFAVIVLAYFVGHARQRAAAAGRHRRRRRRHDRRLRRARRRRRTTRSSPSSPTARSRSGCRRCPARSPTSSCAGASPRGARSIRRPRRRRCAQA